MPKFLFKLYKQLSEKDNESGYDDDTSSSQSNIIDGHDVFADEHDRIVERSDIIMTFLNNRM